MEFPIGSISVERESPASVPVKCPSTHPAVSNSETVQQRKR